MPYQTQNESKEYFIGGLERLQSVYRELYETYDPSGAIAVHIEFDLFINDVIELINAEVSD